MSKIENYYGLKDGNNVFLDKKLDNLFKNKENGFFIELGANNGLLQSNTAFLEKNRNWTGILVEPCSKNYKECIKNRPKSKCFNYACVSNDFKNNKIKGDFNIDNVAESLMASVSSSRRKGYGIKNIPENEVDCITLTKIIDSVNPVKIDLLVLDVEGYEFEVLNGLDFNKYKPDYLLIEIYKKDYEKICSFLNKNNYILKENFSNYNKLNNKSWDGTHNDYLFKNMYHLI